MLAADALRPGRAYACGVAAGYPHRSSSQWADHLEEGSLQGLVALRLMLSSGLTGNGNGVLREAAEAAICQIDGEISELRSLIAEMRPRRETA